MWLHPETEGQQSIGTFFTVSKSDLYWGGLAMWYPGNWTILFVPTLGWEPTLQSLVCQPTGAIPVLSVTPMRQPRQDIDRVVSKLQFTSSLMNLRLINMELQHSDKYSNHMNVWQFYYNNFFCNRCLIVWILYSLSNIPLRLNSISSVYTPTLYMHVCPIQNNSKNLHRTQKYSVRKRQIYILWAVSPFPLLLTGQIAVLSLIMAK